MANAPLRLGLAGLGTVGSGVARLLSSERDWLMRRVDRELVITRVLERDESLRAQNLVPAEAPFMTDIAAFASDPEVDVVIELIGGVTAAGEIIATALKSGKHVITANKALLAEKGRDLFRLAHDNNLHLRYEASVAGGIPIVQTLKTTLAGNRISSIQGILNGTANFILTQMTDHGLDFDTALAQAQELGYAEADPTLDIEGGDSAHKLQLLIRLAFGLDYPFEALPVSGISGLSDLDIQFAGEFGFTVKLIAEAQIVDGRIEAGVFPALVGMEDPLSAVEGSFNAVRLTGNAGPILLHGYGAGSLPTASSVLSDIMAIARGCQPGNTGFAGPADLPRAEILFQDQNVSPYYFRMLVDDQPGRLAKIAGVLGSHDISIAQMVQQTAPGESGQALIVFLTHKALAGNVQQALDMIDQQDLIKAPAVCYRIL